MIGKPEPTFKKDYGRMPVVLLLLLPMVTGTQPNACNSGLHRLSMYRDSNRFP